MMPISGLGVRAALISWHFPGSRLYLACTLSWNYYWDFDFSGIRLDLYYTINVIAILMV